MGIIIWIYWFDDFKLEGTIKLLTIISIWLDSIKFVPLLILSIIIQVNEKIIESNYKILKLCYLILTIIAGVSSIAMPIFLILFF